MAKLTETKIKALRPRERPYKAFDAHGLYLQVPSTGSPRWRVRLSKDGREQHLSLGTYPEVGLEDARARAAQLRAARKRGDHDAAAMLAATLRGAQRPHPVHRTSIGDTLKDVVERWQRDWLSKKGLASSTQVRNDRCLGYLLRELGPQTPIATIDTPTLQEAIQRIERLHGAETPRRALTLANALWRFAMANRIVSGTNPATGLKADDFLKPHKEQRFAAITEPRAFRGLLRAIDAYAGQPVTRLALQILALTFQRPGELRLARWSEFDLDASEPLWVIPVARMKTRESDHTVPLARQTVSLLRELERHRRDEWAFPSLRPARPLSDNTFNVALRSLSYSRDVHVAHGFRSSASSLLHQKGFDHDVIEQQLAHKRPGVAGIYNRSHLLEQRRGMMQAWADYLDDLASL
jgi:integrase